MNLWVYGIANSTNRKGATRGAEIQERTKEKWHCHKMPYHREERNETTDTAGEVVVE